MKVLFLVGHPAHVHLFRNAIGDLHDEGHETSIGCVEKEITKDLLTHYGLSHASIGPSQKEMISKSLDAVRKDIRMVRLIRDFGPDIVVSTGIPYASHAAKLTGIPSIAFSDTEIATLVIKSMLPFVSAVCTPSCFSLDLGSKHVRYNGYHELAYLHPNRFEPDKSVLSEVGLEEGEAFFLLRFSSLDSSHDLGWRGVSAWGDTSLTQLVRKLEEHGRIFIMSEHTMHPDLSRFHLQILPHRLLDLLSYARMYIGEGATMASEAGVLGVPWIFVSRTDRGYLVDQERSYGLGYHFENAADAEEKALELLEDSRLSEKWKSKRQNLLENKIDVTKFIVDFVLGWPDSFEMAKAGGLG
jgi:predicted glycosyltransferase